MLRTALACCALMACKGSPAEDKRAPAQAPLALEVPADAAPPDAPSAPCFALPLDADGERAGLRFLAHRIPPPTKTKPPKLRDVVKLAVGKPTVVAGLKPKLLGDRGSSTIEPLRVPDVLHAQGLLPPESPGAVKLTAPRHLEGAVLEIVGEQVVTLAIGDAGMATLARYREHYAKPRLTVAPIESDYRIRLVPVAVLLDDLDGDGTLEQVSFTRVAMEPANANVKPRESELELGVLWSTGELTFVRVSNDGFHVPAYYVVPPTLSGGNVMLVSMTGDRIALADKRLMKLPRVQVAGEKSCLQTSTTEPAQLAGRR